MELPAALERLLAAWREAPSERLAQLIARVDRRLGRPELDAPTQRARHEQWLAVDAAQDPADVGRLAALLTDGTLAWCRARIGMLASRPRDPRIAAAMLDLLQRPPSTAWFYGEIWPHVLAGLRAHAGPHVARELRWPRLAIPKYELGRRLDARVRRLHAELDTTEPELTAAHVALCAEVEAELAVPDPAEVRLAELLAAVHASPSDLAVRAVYADALLERGDPRGELVQLQLARGDGPPTPRERELLARFQHRWIGALSTPAHQPSFRGGFLDSIHAELLPPFEPAFSTITTLHVPLWTDDAWVAWLAHPGFRALRVVEGMRWRALPALGNVGVTLPIERAAIRWEQVRDPAPLAEVELPALPALHELDLAIGTRALRPGDAADLFAQPWFARAIHRVSADWVAGSVSDWRDVLAASPGLRRLEVIVGDTRHVVER